MAKLPDSRMEMQMVNYTHTVSDDRGGVKVTEADFGTAWL